MLARQQEADIQCWDLMQAEKKIVDSGSDRKTYALGKDVVSYRLLFSR